MYAPEEMMGAYRGLTVYCYGVCASLPQSAHFCLLCALHNAKQWQPDACVREPRKLGFLSIPDTTFTLYMSDQSHGCLD